MILFILDIKKQSKMYLIFSLFCLVFGLIYEYFSHNVYSNYMMYAFLIPLYFGSFISYVIYKFNLKTNYISNSLYNASIITFTVGSIIKGVLDIYGTTNQLIIFYLIGGVILIIGSLASYIVKNID